MVSLLPEVRTSCTGGVGAARVTAVVVTYNGSQHIGPCLRSLADAGLPPEHIVVVDNASHDDTREQVRRAHPDVRLVASAENTGYGQANNVGARLATTEYVLIVNQDVVLEPGAINALVEALDAHGDAALANPMVVLTHDRTRVNACGNNLHYTGITTCRGFDHDVTRYVNVEEISAISGAAFLARRAVFAELGGFDPLFFLYLEDTDLSLRAALAGYRVLLVPSAVVAHTFSPRFPPEKLFWLERNRHMMLLKNLRARTLVALAPSLLAAELLTLGYSILGGPRSIWAKLRAYGWLARRASAIRDARRLTSRARRVSDRAVLDRCVQELDLAEITHPAGRLVIAIINPLFRSWYGLVRPILV
jgi:GT2 family glycosyltransferase